MKKFYLLTIFAMANVLVLKAQVTSYTFSAVGSAFSTIAATAQTLTSGSTDEGYYNALPIGFTFNYNGANYTTVSASTNGWLTFGQNITSAGMTNSLSTGGNRPVIAPLWDDLDMASGALRILTTGTAPNRICTIEWRNVEWYYGASGAVISFQVKLYETTNVIEFIYRQDANAVSSGSASIGITDVATGAGNYMSLNNTSAAPTPSSAVETTSLNTKPATDQVYRWTPANMVYNSCTTTQTNTSAVAPGNTQEQIIGIQVVTTGTNNPLLTGNFNFTTTGTTNAPVDISNARLYYTGGSNTFATTTQVGATVAAPSGAFIINANQLLAGGTNYFWLAYDIPAGATLGNTVDATCGSLFVSAVSRIPTVTDPGAGRPIASIYLMNNTNVTTCSGTFYDSQGPSAMYNNSESFTKTFTPATAGNMIMATFTAFNTESAYDYLYVYNGPTTASPQVAGSPFNGTTIPAAITSTAAGGELTFRFTSDGSGQRDGWACNISCYVPGPMTYTSSAVAQPNTAVVCPNTTSNEVIRIEVVTNGSLAPISATSFTFRTNGTTNAADIANAKVFYTGTSSTFATTTQFGSTYATPPATGINMIIGGSQVLATGTNYFWLTYDVVAAATITNLIDARCLSITVAGTPQTPVPTTVAGERTISNTGCPPPNDDCVNAIEVVTGTYSGSNYFADLWGPFADDPSTAQFNCNGSIDNVIFYYFTTGATGGNINVAFSSISCDGSDGIQTALFQTATPCLGGANWNNALFCTSPWSTGNFNMNCTALAPNTTYYLLVDGWAGDECSFSMTLTGDLVLPVELISADANCLPNNHVMLSWTTASEVNNDRFVIERSTDMINFFPVAMVSGAGNSNSITEYSWYDKSKNDGVAYYKLSQVDFDGTRIDLKSLPVSCDFNGGFSFINVYENELGLVQLVYTVEETDQMQVVITDVGGQVMHTESFYPSSTGVNEAMLHFDFPTQKLFFVTLYYNGAVASRKLISK